MSTDDHIYTAQMRREAYDAWLAELESGTRTQTFGHLQDEKGHCCLGVFCEVAVAAGVKMDVERFDDMSLKLPFRQPDDRATHFDNHACELPASVIEWAGLRALHSSGKPSTFDAADPYLGNQPASQWNDEDKADFHQIAHLIRQHIKPVDF